MIEVHIITARAVHHIMNLVNGKVVIVPPPTTPAGQQKPTP